jgi:hypothetical protein
MIKEPDIELLTCGGRIVCRRCKASSVRTKHQCGRPAIKGKSVCQFHGGRSTGPKSEQSKIRLRTLNLKKGFFTAEAKENMRKDSIKLRYLEDIGYHLGMISARTRGRKPNGYFRLNLNDATQLGIALLASGYKHQ